MLKNTKKFYEEEYEKYGLRAQRRWPNEEFCRFMGRNFFPLSCQKRKSTKILEVGCGTGANLRLLIDEGFDAYGIELSQEAVNLIPLLLKTGGNYEVSCGNMMSLPWQDDFLMQS